MVFPVTVRRLNSSSVMALNLRHKRLHRTVWEYYSPPSTKKSNSFLRPSYYKSE